MPISGGHVNYLVAAHAQRKPLRIRGGILFNDRLAASPAMALVSFYRNFTNDQISRLSGSFMSSPSPWLSRPSLPML